MVRKTKNEITSELLGVLGDIFANARTSKGQTLDVAAEALNMRSDKNAKANVHNIEKGKIFLPWKRIVAFARYTQRDPASILVTLAAARAFDEIEDLTEAKKLYASLKTFLNLSPKEHLTDLPREADRLSVEHYRTVVEPPKPIRFWQAFKEWFLVDIKLNHKVAPTTGLFSEHSLLSRSFSPIEAPKIMLRGAGGDGIELILLDYLNEYDQLFPIYIDGRSVRSLDLEEHVDRIFFKRTPSLRHLSLSSPELRSSFIFIVHDLPTESNRLAQLSAAIEKLLDKYSTCGCFVVDVPSPQISKAEPIFNGIGFNCFTSLPLSETDALTVLKQQAGSAGIKSFNEGLEDWAYLLVRHPLWLGVFCRLIKELRRVPHKWEVVRSCASVLTNGPSPDRIMREGLYPSIRDAEGKIADARFTFLRRLCNAADASISETLPQESFDLDVNVIRSAKYEPSGPLVESVGKDGYRFTFSLIRCYFAAINRLFALAHANERELKKAIQTQIDEVSAIYDTSDTQRSPAVELCLALLWDAYPHERKIYEMLHAGFKGAATRGFGLAHNVIRALDIDDRQLDEAARPFAKPRPTIEVETVEESELVRKKQSVGPMDLRVMIEAQVPGQALLSLANTDVLKVPSREGRDDALIVQPMLLGYGIIREKIQQAIDYCNNVKETPEPDADIIICPHFSLAWQMAANHCAVAITTEQIPELANLGFLAHHYCKYQGHWIGIPFQFPTKFLCYRNDIITHPPSSQPD